MSDKSRMIAGEATPKHSEAIGRVVYSKAGRDKKRVFLIVGLNEDGTVDIADGKLRKLAKPKRKNLAHLDIRETQFSIEGFDDAAIRELLRSYEMAR